MPKVNPGAFRSKNKKKYLSLSLIVTKRCNLRCLYCYEKHHLRDKKVMDISLAEKEICYYMERDDNFDGVEIEFFGGEPMLEFPFIKEIVDWLHSRSWPKEHIFLIGTNGTILTSDMKEWLLKNKKCVNMGVSIDGTKIAHDLARDNSYDMLAKNLSFFKENWPHQPAKMTICAQTIPYLAESIIELEEMEINFTANIGFENIWGAGQEKQELLEIYEEQLATLVDYYFKHPNLFPAGPILNILPEHLGIPDVDITGQRDIVRYCGAGHEMVVLDVDGKKYPCHRFLPWVTGISVPVKDVNCQTAWKPEECRKCKLIDSCPTCAGYNWEIHQDTGLRTTFHCESYQLEVKASANLEALKLQKQLYEVELLPLKEQKRIKKRLGAVLELIENGFR